MKKNVIFLTIDSLMPGRAGFGGGVKGLSPKLDWFAENSLFCCNTFTMGNPTEFALPGLFASSMLLDEGGYAEGIAKRKKTLAEVLQDHGYQTGAFFPLYRPFSNGYQRGFDNFFYLYDVNVLLKNFANTSSWYRDQYSAGEMTLEECLDELVWYCDSYLSDIIRYCEIWDGYLKNPIIPESLIFKNYDFRDFKQEIEHEQERYTANKIDYIADYLKGDSFPFVKIIEKRVKARVRKAHLSWPEIKFRLILLRNLFSTWNLCTSYQSSKNTFALALYRVLQGQQHWIKYPSGGYILDTFKNWVDSLNNSSPFYAYMHWVDVHELNHFSYDLPKQSARKNKEINLVKDALRDIVSNRGKYHGNILFDSAIRYADHLVTQLYDYLDKKKILDNTLLIISADHGGNYPNVPNREGTSHRVNQFFDELYHIPLIISGSDIVPIEYPHLVSSLDIGPTILDMVNIKCPESFKGYAITIDKPFRDHVIMEDQGRGPCDLHRKPIRVCVRTEGYKLVYEAEPPPSGNSFIVEIYDLQNDPEEYNNLADNKEVVVQVKPLVRIAMERIEQIRSYLDDIPQL